MKKYFAKYLPIKGEIKEGFYTDITEPNSLFKAEQGNIPLQPSEDFKKVKLFLCSRDIQVEDWNVKGEVYILHDEPVEGAFRVIGEISPAAVWVKEGDEFDEEEIKLGYLDDEGMIWISTEIAAFTGYTGKFTTVCQIKCPICKTFH